MGPSTCPVTLCHSGAVKTTGRISSADFTRTPAGRARTNLRVILKSALDMSRQLGLVTVAEGIETLPDWQLVRDSGCGVGQGFLVARAMPADELPAWIATHEARLRELGTGE